MNLLYPKELDSKVKRSIGCGSQVGVGWFDLLIKLDKDIEKIYPEYAIDQVKEKFGTLRFYIGSVPEEHFDAIYELIHEAEAKSSVTCDVCGKAGKGIGINGWYVTRCEEHEKPD